MQQQNQLKGAKTIYSIETLVKQNEQSRIKFGVDQKAQKKVIIKIQDHIDPIELEYLQRFSKSQGFQNVVNILDVIQDKNAKWNIIMEYANMGDLQKYLKKNNTIDQVQIKQIMIQIAQGLKELHQQKLVHRNISFENILVFEENNSFSYKITDFGLLKQEDIAVTTKIGTIQNMAPELLRDRFHQYNYKYEVDIWALGCIYYQLIVKQSLFQDIENNFVLNNDMQKWIDVQIQQINATQRVKDLLKQMISIDPKTRPDISCVLEVLMNSDGQIRQNQQQVIQLLKISQKQRPNQPIIIQNKNQQIQKPPLINYAPIHNKPIITNISNQHQNPVIQLFQQSKQRVPLVPNCTKINQYPQELQQEKDEIDKIINDLDSKLNGNTLLQKEFQEELLQIKKSFQQLVAKIEQNRIFTLTIENLKETANQLKQNCSEFSQRIREYQISIYQQNLQITQQTVKNFLFKIEEDLKELNQVQTKTKEVNNFIQTLERQYQQLQGQLTKYEQLMFQSKQNDNMEIDQNILINESVEIDRQQKSIQSQYIQLFEQFTIYSMDNLQESIIKMINQNIKIKNQIDEKRKTMEEIIKEQIKQSKTNKTQEECESILKQYLQEEQIIHDCKQSIDVAIEIQQQYSETQKSLINIDQDLQQILFLTQTMNQYSQNLSNTETIEEEIQKFIVAINYQPQNQENYLKNKALLRANIKDSILINQIIQMKDQGKNQEIKKQMYAVVQRIKEKVIEKLRD